jgi:hypothetical protein
MADDIAIFTVDPGGSTGVTWGVYSLRCSLVKNAMASRTEAGSITIEGSEAVQVNKLWDLWHTFEADNLGARKIELVIEDFILLPKIHTPGKEGISPVRIAWGLVGYIWGQNDLVGDPDPIWQSASIGMRFNTRQMLEQWGCWIKGREHERAAYAHAGARLMRLYQS